MKQRAKSGKNSVFECWQPKPSDRREAIKMDRDSSVWLFFTKKAPFTATCNTCNQDYSFRASTSNLRKHWYNKHGGKRAKVFEAKQSEVSGNTSSNSDEEVEQDKAVATIVKTTKSMVTWKYFDPLDLEKYEATCTICGKTISFKYLVDLKHHVQEHGYEPMDSDEEFVSEIQEKKLLKRRQKSKLWEYFRITDDKMAECLMCHKLLNYGSTITNLRRHLMRKHEEAALSCQNDPKVEYSEQTIEFVEEDNDDQQKSLDALYLNEEHLEDSFDGEIKPPTPKKKLINIPTKRNQKITKEQVHRSRDTCSEEPELLRKPIPTNTPTNTMGSLDYFGQYVISLLKELPKSVSDQLQSEIIKQILTSKMALESQTVVTNYEIIKNKNDTNVPVPITYNIVRSNETAEMLDEITEKAVDQ